MGDATFPGLPADVLSCVQDLLSYASRVALRCTCPELRAKVKDPNGATGKASSATNISSQPSALPYTMEDLLETELWPEYNGAPHREGGHHKQLIRGHDFFACHLCLKIRCASHFSNAMMRSKRGKIGLGNTAYKIGRFCASCGVRSGKYIRGVSFMMGGVQGGYGLVCQTCGRYERVECGFETTLHGALCESCRYGAHNANIRASFSKFLY
jgi:hypothetical protein